MDKIALDTYIYDQVRADKTNLSTFLEKKYPTPKEGKLDAFERAMMQVGIRTKSDLTKGYHADEMEAFIVPRNRILFPECVAHTVREAVSKYYSPLLDSGKHLH